LKGRELEPEKLKSLICGYPRTRYRKNRVAAVSRLLYNTNMENLQSLTQQAENYQRVEQAIEYLAGNFRQQPDLEEIATHLNLSKYHFQRIFKQWAGVTPSQFLRYLTVEYAKERLHESRSLLSTSLDSGLSSPGRLHDLFITFEAMTPGTYKRGGEGVVIHYGIHPTPFGRCLLALTDRGICALWFLSQDACSDLLADLRQEWPQAEFMKSKQRTARVIQRLFAPLGREEPVKIHLLVKGTNFQVQVWRALLAVPPGELVSYGDLAAQIGKPTAARAVAGSVARNPIGYLIPCHRVINRLGEAHGYRWGVSRKRAILGWEAARVNPPDP
jgi:AraC family transcriptional regulator of adaptative response/methylated-DNA-[protein]-cysteine methyltransferase